MTISTEMCILHFTIQKLKGKRLRNEHNSTYFLEIKAAGA